MFDTIMTKKELKQFHSMFLICYFVIIVCILLLVYSFSEPNNCAQGKNSSTYTMIDMNLDSTAAYKLYYYCDLPRCNKSQPLVSFYNSANIPVLFVPGNADSPDRISRLAFAVHMELINIGLRGVDFDFFAMSFLKERAAFYGPLLEQEIKFTQQSIEFILNRYWQVSEEKRPKSVMLIGNSMGGVVARGVFLNGFDSQKVNTIITLASPHRDPVVNLDRVMNKLYVRLNQEIWTSRAVENVTLVSLHGGIIDQQVTPDLSDMVFLKNKSSAFILSKQTTSIPWLWKSIGHADMTSCASFLQICARALINLVDVKNTQQIHSNKSTRSQVLVRFFSDDDFSDYSGSSSITYNSTLYHVDTLNSSSIRLDQRYTNVNNKLVVLTNMSSFLNTSSSFFLYTNLTRHNLQTIRLCKNISLLNETYTCHQAVSLVSKLPVAFMRLNQSIVAVINLFNSSAYLNFTALMICLNKSDQLAFVGLHVNASERQFTFSSLENPVVEAFRWNEEYKYEKNASCKSNNTCQTPEIAVALNDADGNYRLPKPGDLLFATNSVKQLTMYGIDFAPQPPTNASITYSPYTRISFYLYYRYYRMLIPSFMTFLLHFYTVMFYISDRLRTDSILAERSYYHIVLWDGISSSLFNLTIIIIMFLYFFFVSDIAYDHLHLGITTSWGLFYIALLILYFGSWLLSLFITLAIWVITKVRFIVTHKLFISIFYILSIFFVTVFGSYHRGLLILFFFTMFYVSVGLSRWSLVSKHHFDCQLWSILILVFLTNPSHLVWRDLVKNQGCGSLVFGFPGDHSFWLTLIVIFGTSVEKIILHHNIRIKPIRNTVLRRAFKSIMVFLIIATAISSLLFSLNKLYRLQYFIVFNMILSSVSHLYFYKENNRPILPD